MLETIMTIHSSPAKIHWNYFLALEKDLESLSRYIEFSESNFYVYSIELAHLLFAAASEVDVIAKMLCIQIAPNAPRGNINEYREVLLPNIHALATTQVRIPRYGLHFSPWENWANGSNPDWWRSYNNVKHERNAYFHEATLKNALNALGALHILTFHLYWLALKTNANILPGPTEANAQLHPRSSLLRLDEQFASLE